MNARIRITGGVAAIASAWVAGLALAAGGGGGGGGGSGDGGGGGGSGGGGKPGFGGQVQSPSRAWTDDVAGGALHEEPARFLPGTYYFKKGNWYYHKGDYETAAQLWKTAASWAQKAAQYNLGILYYKGKGGFAVNRPLGAAWLALASERHDVVFESSLAAAMDELTPAERDQANALWRDMKPTYGDAVAARRAKAHFDREMHNLTGSHAGGAGAGALKVWGVREGNFDGATYIAKLQREADDYFEPVKAWVDVKPLESVDDPPPPHVAAQPPARNR